MMASDICVRITGNIRHSAIYAVLSFAIATLPTLGQTVVATVPIPANPTAIAVNTATSKVYISGLGNVTVIDGATNAATLISNPLANGGAIAVNSVTNKIYIANFQSNTVSVIDGATNAITTVTDPNALAPTDIEVNAVTNKIYVANSESNNVTIIDGATNTTTTLKDRDVIFPFKIAVNAASNMIYVANSGTITVINGASNAITNIQDAGSFPEDIAVNSATNKIYVSNSLNSIGSLSVIDGSTNASFSTPPFPALARFLAVNPNTNLLYGLTNTGVLVFNGATVALISSIVDPNAVTPTGFALNAAINKIYVANYGSDNVSVIDAATRAVTTIQDPKAQSPSLIAVNPMTNKVYVVNIGSRNVTVIDSAATPTKLPPSCQLSSIVAGPPMKLLVSMQDTGSGLQSISVVESVNASINVPAFSPGTTDMVLATGTKLNQSQSSSVGFVVTNTAGLTTSCDPVDFKLELDTAREQHVFRSLPATEHYVRIVNGTPGVQGLTFLVNGHRFPVPDLQDGEKYFLDIGSAMITDVIPGAAADRRTLRRGAGGENNNVVMYATGPRGASVYVLIGDASVK